jgi:hypothetical protein
VLSRLMLYTGSVRRNLLLAPNCSTSRTWALRSSAYAARANMTMPAVVASRTKVTVPVSESWRARAVTRGPPVSSLAGSGTVRRCRARACRPRAWCRRAPTRGRGGQSAVRVANGLDPDPQASGRPAPRPVRRLDPNTPRGRYSPRSWTSALGAGRRRKPSSGSRRTASRAAIRLASALAVGCMLCPTMGEPAAAADAPPTAPVTISIVHRHDPVIRFPCTTRPSWATASCRTTKPRSRPATARPPRTP